VSTRLWLQTDDGDRLEVQTAEGTVCGRLLRDLQCSETRRNTNSGKKGDVDETETLETAV
jgi:hypothetical protein